MNETLTIYHPRPDLIFDLVRERAPDLRVTAVSRHDEAAKALWDTEILIAGPRDVSGLLDRRAAPALRWIQSASAGVEFLLKERDAIGPIPVTNARGIHAAQMSDHALGAMFMLNWDMPQMLRDQAARRWNRGPRSALAGQTVGIVGSGAVGGEIGRRAAEFGMRVLGVRRGDGAAPPGFAAMYGADRLNDCLGQCDFVVVTVPATPATAGMFGAAQFAAMKSTAGFINLARGSVVDEPALIHALQTGQIGSAALDVFAKEPPDPDNPLWSMPNVIMTPHISGMSAENEALLVDLFLRNLDNYRQGRPLLNLVDPERGY